MSYDGSMTMREARARYFEDNDFGEDGGYNDAWVDFKLGPIPFPFPNTPMRVRAVQYHDMHHLITGYATDFRGELEISAWELGAGCRDFLAAWQLNLGGLAAGMFFMPGRIVRAFLRGRRSQSLYGKPLEALLDKTVAEVQREMGVPAGVPSVRPSDLLLLALAFLVGLAVGIVTMAMGLVTLPLAYLVFAKRARAAREAATT